MIVYGPRGNGKTALLRYLQKETLKKEGSKLDILWTTPISLEHPEVFADLVIGDNASLRNKISSAISRFGRTPGIRYLLQERCQRKPLILIIDEAHCLDPKMAGVLLNESQTIRNDGHPFLLVLAGTPDLPGTLRKSEAGFWERSEICRLGRLSPEEAMQARSSRFSVRSAKPGFQGLYWVDNPWFRHGLADFGRTSPNPRCLSTCRGSTRKGSGGVQANGHHTEQFLVRTGTAQQ